MQLSTCFIALQWLMLVSALTPRSVGKSLILAKQGLRSILKVPASYSNLSMPLGEFNERGLNLFARQENECQDPGYLPCSDGLHCCPAGDDCQPDRCCSAGESSCGTDGCYDAETQSCCSDGTHCDEGYDCVEGGCCPSGQQPCGGTKCYDPTSEVCCDAGEVGTCDNGQQCCGSSHCYDPSTEQCCPNDVGACDQDEKCCQEECCFSYATCGSDGYCSGITCTTTSTVKSTSFQIYQKTVTVVKAEGENDGEDEPDFSCAAMTVTNSLSDTLELGDDCQLTFSAASAPATTTDGSVNELAPSAALAGRSPALLQARATADCAYTTTIVSTNVIPASTTLTQTVTEESLSESFSCVPMSVTNAAGDELSLDEECQVEFSLAPPTAAPTSTGGGGGASSASRLATCKLLACFSIAIAARAWW